MKYYLALHNCIIFPCSCDHEIEYITLINENGEQLKADLFVDFKNNINLSDEFRFILNFIDYNIVFEITENDAQNFKNILNLGDYCSASEFVIKNNILYLYEPEGVALICEINNSKVEFFKK